MLDYALLRFIWWLLIGLLLVGFAITDGFDMGVGMLLTLIGKTNTQRRIMINTIAPHWDGNQVWLLLTGGAMFAAWPLVYATACSSFYSVIILLLAALCCRPLGFEYRQKIPHPTWRQILDSALTIGSTLPPLLFGIAVGNVLQGLPFTLDPLSRPHYHGTFFELLNPFALLCGVISVALLMMQGGAWLQLKTCGTLQHSACKATQRVAIVLIVALSVAAVWLNQKIAGYCLLTPLDPRAASNPLNKAVVQQFGLWWGKFTHSPALLLFPLLGLLAPLMTLLASRCNRNGWSFFWSSCSAAGTIMTAGILLFPFILPSRLVPSHSLTVWDATSSQKTLTLMLYVVSGVLPLVLSYSIWCYYKMAGRLDEHHIEQHQHSLY